MSSANESDDAHSLSRKFFIHIFLQIFEIFYFENWLRWSEKIFYQHIIKIIHGIFKNDSGQKSKCQISKKTFLEYP